MYVCMYVYIHTYIHTTVAILAQAAARSYEFPCCVCLSSLSATMDGAAPLLNDLHGRMLREVCLHDGRHYEGLGAAGRCLFRRGLVDGKMKKKMIALDCVTAHLRHVSVPLCNDLLARLRALLGAHQASCDGPTSVKEKLDTLQQDIRDFEAGIDRLKTVHVDTTKISVEEVIPAEVDKFFKTLRGQCATVWPPIAGLSEEDARAKVAKMSEMLLGPLNLNEEEMVAARLLLAAKCEEGMDAWKRYVLANVAQRDAVAVEEQMRKRARWKAISKR